MDNKNYKDNLKNWFEQKILINDKDLKSNSFHKKWEIWYVDFWINIWSEFNNKRPAIIISNKSFSWWWNIIVVPITKLLDSKNILNTDIIIEDKNLNYKSIIKLNNIRDISKKRLVRKLWRLSDEILKNIDLKLKAIFDIRD